MKSVTQTLIVIGLISAGIMYGLSGVAAYEEVSIKTFPIHFIDSGRWIKKQDYYVRVQEFLHNYKRYKGTMFIHGDTVIEEIRVGRSLLGIQIYRKEDRKVINKNPFNKKK